MGNGNSALGQQGDRALMTGRRRAVSVKHFVQARRPSKHRDEAERREYDEGRPPPEGSHGAPVGGFPAIRP